MSKTCSRRTCLGMLASGTIGLGLGTPARAQTFPGKTIQIVVPFPAGGATDAVARLLAERMAPRLGKAVIVDNKGGAAGVLGTDTVAKAPPDGHTLSVSLTTNLLINQFLFKKLPYNPQRDLALVSQIALAPIVLLVHPGVPARTGPELLRHIAANKGKLSFGSWGNGSAGHLSGAFMSQSQDAGMSHVPYKGEAPMVQDLIGGQVQMAFASAQQAKPFVDAGRLRAIGITGEQRMSVLPNVPTLLEQGLTDDVYRITGWVAMAAPGATPKAVVQRIADEVRAACEQPDVRARITALGFTAVARGPEEFAAAYRKDLPVWERLVKATGATLD
ncbi:tripartite tricarboxylate transporter substrate binding protein [Piscinibacter sp. XHJ-5]|uniref:Bug family tripartite tricarboxylate transporter substrate binding protein n=1 Tax=Piscinibacter sp. XHJ-5 TaxID=3037797 RepID=UPI002452D0F2|nr:tripartite tricarboxylate transporter substrate binding protein [Piscinibacter sp. XHJ-5]